MGFLPLSSPSPSVYSLVLPFCYSPLFTSKVYLEKTNFYIMATTEKSDLTPPQLGSFVSDTGDESGLGSRVTLSEDEAQFDTWRGWIVVTAASCSFFMYMGVIYSWGILQAKMADTRGYSLTTLTFVGSLATSFMVSLCILVGKMVRKHGYRNVALVGAVFLGLGEFLSSWVVGHPWALFITHGILFGVGGGLTTLV